MRVFVRNADCHEDCLEVGSDCLVTVGPQGLVRAECMTCTTVLAAKHCTPGSDEWRTLVDVATDHARWHLRQTDKEGTTMTPTTDECVPPTGSTRPDGPTLERAIQYARDFTTPGEVNAEYVRGQAELICDLFSIPTDPGAGAIAAVISHEVSSATGLLVWMHENEWLR